MILQKFPNDLQVLSEFYSAKKIRSLLIFILLLYNLHSECKREQESRKMSFAESSQVSAASSKSFTATSHSVQMKNMPPMRVSTSTKIGADLMNNTSKEAKKSKFSRIETNRSNKNTTNFCFNSLE